MSFVFLKNPQKPIPIKRLLPMNIQALPTAGKFDLAKRAKALNLDAIHDTVHEMAKDEARHGKAFEGLLKRYFG